MENKEAPKFNPRYVCYARAHGKTPEAMLAAQIADGSHNRGFVSWNNQKMWECRQEHPEYFMYGTIKDHEAYDRWLEEHSQGVEDGLGK
ncbi:MAG: hypothetical protein PHI12_14110 [Dehalococcoidales bacterium]|nr:hypothetical protein [Dehalococcoidales bacterium]